MANETAYTKMSGKLGVRLLCLTMLFLWGCAGAPSAPSMPTGLWGGDHISMTITESGAHLELDCAHGDIRSPLPAASFTIPGTFVRERGGPIRVDDTDSHPAMYSASISANTMSLTIRVTDSGETLGPFALVRGTAGRVVKCL